MDTRTFQSPEASPTANAAPKAPTRASAPERDPLLVCLALAAKRIDRAVHLSALRTGFAVDAQGRIPTSAYPDLAQLHGMIAVWSRTALTQLPAYALPVIVPLVDGRAAVLVSVILMFSSVMLPSFLIVMAKNMSDCVSHGSP